jgi:DNA-binding CsgD family transcriptional regulator
LYTISFIGQTIIKPERLTNEDGLSQGFIADLYEDTNGFLWLGTKAGLDRYDGRGFKHYKEHTQKITSQLNYQIRCIDGGTDFMIVGTEKDLYLYKNRYDRFFSFNLGIGIGDILKSDNNTFWIVDIQGKFYKLTLDESMLDSVMTKEDFINSYAVKQIPDVSINSYFRLTTWNNRIVFLQNSEAYKKLYSFEPTTEKVSEIPLYKNTSIPSADPFHFITIGDYIIANNNRDNSIHIYNGTSWKSIKTDFNIENIIALTHKKMVVFDILGEYVFFDLATLYTNDEIRKSQAAFLLDSEKRGFRNHIEDTSGNIWIGTDGHGLLKIGERQFKIQHYFKGKSIYAKPFISKKGTIFIENPTTQESLIINKDAGEYNHLVEFAETHYDITLVQNQKDHTIWAVSKEDAYFEISKLTEQGFVTVMRINVPRKNHQTLVEYNEETGELVVVVHSKIIFVDTIKKTTIIEDIAETTGLFCLLRTDTNTYWIGTSHGIIKVKKSGNILSKEIINAQNSELSNEKISSIHKDQNDANTLWIGTKGGGLNAYDIKGKAFKHFSPIENLPDNVIYGILEDDNNNLWLSSNLGIIVYNKETKEIKNFLKHDGLQGNEFNTYAYAKDADGHFYFGGINGLNVFQPNEIHTNQHLAEVFITDFKVNHKNIDLITDVSYLDKITLASTENNFSLQFSATELSTPFKNKFSYYLEGAETAWIHTTENNTANYVNVAPGMYTFKIKASNGDAIWNPNYKQLTIKIKAPWYKTIVAYIFYILVFIWLLVLFIKYRENRINRLREIEKAQLQNQILENKIVNKQKDLMDLANTISENTKWRDYLLNALQKIKVSKGRTKDKHFNELINEIKIKTSVENNRLEYQKKIDTLNNEFYSNLLHQYPNLTQNELRLCSLLKLDLTSKEIAQIQNIELKSVYINRSRLRKKMGLAPEVDLSNALKEV